MPITPKPSLDDIKVAIVETHERLDALLRRINVLTNHVELARSSLQTIQFAAEDLNDWYQTRNACAVTTP